MAFPQQQGNTRAKTIFNDYTQPHPETEQPLQGARNNGQLRFEQKVNNAWVLRVYDNVWNDQKRITREVEVNYNERGNIFDAVRQAADMSVDFVQACIPINQKGWVRGPDGKTKPSDEPINQCNIIIARDEKNRVTMTYQKADYKFTTVFRLHNAPAWKMRGKDGNVYEDFGAPSRAAARSWCNFHEQAMNTLSISTYVPRAPKTPAGGNGGGGWNNNGGGNGGNSGGNGGGGMNQMTQDFDDTIEDW